MSARLVYSNDKLDRNQGSAARPLMRTHGSRMMPVQSANDVVYLVKEHQMIHDTPGRRFFGAPGLIGGVTELYVELGRDGSLYYMDKASGEDQAVPVQWFGDTCIGRIADHGDW